MMLVGGHNGKAYRVLTPTFLRRVANRYRDAYDVRVTSGDTYLVQGSAGIDDYLVDVVGYPRDGNGSPVKLESLD